MQKVLSIIHYPNLKTVLAVEKVLQDAKEPLSRAEVKRRLKTKIMHQTLNIILQYLVDSGKILDTRFGPVWTYCPPKEMAKIRKNAVPLDEILRKSGARHAKDLNNSRKNEGSGN